MRARILAVVEGDKASGLLQLLLSGTSFRMRIYQLDIRVTNAEPRFCRTLLIDAGTNLAVAGWVVEAAMGWRGEAGAEIWDGELCYTYDKQWTYPDEPEFLDIRKYKLEDVLRREGDRIEYRYNIMADGWEHEVTLERVLKARQGGRYPRCIGGRYECPFTDEHWSADNWEELKDLFEDPEGEDHELAVEMLGGDYDWRTFDQEAANRRIARVAQGVWCCGVVDVPGSKLAVAVLFNEELLRCDLAPRSEIRDVAARLIKDAKLEPCVTPPYTVLVESKALGRYLAKGSPWWATVAYSPEVGEYDIEELARWAVSTDRDLCRMKPMARFVGEKVLRRFYEAASVLYESGFWHRMEPSLVVCVDRGSRREAVAAVRHHGHAPGLLCAPDVEDLWPLQGSATQGLPLLPYTRDLGPVYLLHFVQGADVPPGVRREISDLALPVASAGAYPRLKVIGEEGFTDPGADDLESMSHLYEVVGKFSAGLPTHVRPWARFRRNVETGRGQATITYPHPDLGPEQPVFYDSDFEEMARSDERIAAAALHIGEITDRCTEVVLEDEVEK